MSIGSLIMWRQVYHLTLCNLKARYRKTFVGFLWVVFNPILMFTVQSYLFKAVLKMNMSNYPIFLLSGLLPWIFLTQSLDMCTGILVNSGRLLRSFPVHPFVYILAQLFDNLINFLAAFVVIGIPVALKEFQWSLPGLQSCLHVLLLIFPVTIFFVAVSALCVSLSIIHVFLRDTRFIVSFVLQVAYFITPIFYPAEFVPEGYRWLIECNLLYYFIKPFRAVLYSFDMNEFVHQTLISAALAAGLSVVAWLFWRRSRNAIYFNV